MQKDTEPSARPEQSPDSIHSINCIVNRVPPFWPERPAVWFEQLKWQFALPNITLDETKY